MEDNSGPFGIQKKGDKIIVPETAINSQFGVPGEVAPRGGDNNDDTEHLPGGNRSNEDTQPLPGKQ